MLELNVTNIVCSLTPRPLTADGKGHKTDSLYIGCLKDKLQTAVRSQPNLSNVETMHRMMNIKGHHKIDYDSYLALLRHAAQTYDSEQQKVGNPK